MTGSDPKVSARELLEEAHPALVGLSHWIHANPEVGFEEILAAGWVAEWLTTAGFEVETGVAGLSTAVVGRTGPGPFHVAVCVEYDALPEVGHACGHNVIAAAGVGAGLALASIADELGLRVTVLGTPAEESGGGKLQLIDAGAFDGVHAALMVHPWPTDIAMPGIIAVNQLEVTYTGREAHAAGFPQDGRNAADALVVAQTAIGLLRQQLLSTDRVHGIVTRGGDAPNIIPAHTSALFMVRAANLARLTELTRLVSRCFQAGALATGTEVSIVEGKPYSDMVHDPDLAALYRHNAELLGRVFDDSDRGTLSTDMGNVSYVVPSIHPMISIDSAGAGNHQPAFADACATPSADQAILDGAVAMAWTVIDAVQDEVVRARLMGAALAREADTLAREAAQLQQEAETLAAAARSVSTLDAEAAMELALASAVLDTEADELVAVAGERLDDAAALAEAAVADEVSGELASDADDLRYQAATIGETSDELADEATQDLKAAADLERQAAEFQAEADVLAGADPGSAELLVATAATLQVEAQGLRDDADLRAAGAADLAGEAAFVLSVSDDLSDEAGAVAAAVGHEPPGYEWLEPPADELADQATELSIEADALAGGAFAFAAAAEQEATAAGGLEVEAGSLQGEATTLAASAFTFMDATDAALDEVAEDATIAVAAGEEAVDLEAVADGLVEAAAELATESSDLSSQADELSARARAAAADPDSAELLADTAFRYQTEAQATADAAEEAFQQALRIEDQAKAADELAEVATEAAEDAREVAIGDAAMAQGLARDALATDGLAEVVEEAAEDSRLAALEDAAVAEALAEQSVRADDLAEVVLEAAEDATTAAVERPADAGPSAGAAELNVRHHDWEEQFRQVSTHAAWEDEYARVASRDGLAVDDPSDERPEAPGVAPALTSEVEVPSTQDRAPVEDAWYSGPPEPDGTPGLGEAAETDGQAMPSTGSSVEAQPAGSTDFRWIPGGPDD